MTIKQLKILAEALAYHFLPADMREQKVHIDYFVDNLEILIEPTIPALFYVGYYDFKLRLLENNRQAVLVVTKLVVPNPDYKDPRLSEL